MREHALGQGSPFPQRLHKKSDCKRLRELQRAHDCAGQQKAGA